MIKVWILTLTFLGYEGRFDTNQYTFSNQHDCLLARDYVVKKYSKNDSISVDGFCLQTDNVNR